LSVNYTIVLTQRNKGGNLHCNALHSGMPWHHKRNDCYCCATYIILMCNVFRVIHFHWLGLVSSI